MLLLAFLVAALSAMAQGNVLSKIGAWSKTTFTVPEIRTASQILSQRVDRSIRQAKQAYQTLPENFPINIYYAPVVNMTNASTYYNTALYVQVPFVNTTQKFKNYVIAQNNRLLANETRRLHDLAPVLENYYPAIKRRAQFLERVPKYQHFTQTQWLEELVRLIPAKTRYLFIGEQHGFAEIQQVLQEFASRLRRTRPQQKIILFSEFLPKGISFSSVQAMQSSRFDLNKHVENSYIEFFEKVLAENITVVGLEHPDYYDFYPYVQTLGTQPQNMPFWNTLEGVRQRNALWHQVLQTHRAENPDALFVIHTGAGHALYNRPFSLASRFAPEETFVAAFYPKSTAANYYKDPVELLYKPAELPEKFLHLFVPAHIEAAGFNARLRIAVSN